MRKVFIHIYSQEAAMRDLIMVLIILILIALLCVYVHLSLTLSSIDTISIETEEYMDLERVDPISRLIIRREEDEGDEAEPS